MKNTLFVLALSAAVTALVGCKAPEGKIACSLTPATQASCSYNGVTIIADIPPDVAAIVGIVEPIVFGDTSGRVSSLSIAREVPKNVTVTADSKNHTITLVNTITGKAASFPYQDPK